MRTQMVLGPQALAAMLGVSARTLVRWRKAGRLPAPIPGLPRPRWSAERVAEWLKTVK